MKRNISIILILAAIAAAPAFAQQHEHGAQPAERLGKVNFEVSCPAEVKADFSRGVALLHSFWYAAAIEQFNAIEKKAPGCAMVHWGVAMGIWGNPLGGTRTPETFARGRAVARRALTASNITPRERDYIAAVNTLYAEPDTMPMPSRTAAYEEKMAALVAAYPNDSEAAVFYAIALVAAAPPTDQTYAKQLKAAGILEKVFATQPDHPGITHYLIHSYDVPKLADKGLAAARRYASIAPDAPHALHMPSHIFTRVGAWQDSIDSNKASAAAAKKANSAPEELHAMDYQVYANLQLARDDEAKRLLGETEAILARVDAGSGYGLAGFYGASAIPARVALERGAWAEAANLTVRPGSFPHTEAMTWFAKAIGAARSKQFDQARAHLAKLAPLRDALTAKNDAYWAGQVEIQRKTAEGVILFQEAMGSGASSAAALELLRAAADAEDGTEKSPVTPGSLVPARELYAESLVMSRRFSDALAEFEKTLTRESGRFRSIAGAMRAAQAANNTAKAKKYAVDLLALAKSASPGRPEIEEAKKLAK
jgi:hypothetical protein